MKNGFVMNGYIPGQSSYDIYTNVNYIILYV